MIYATVCSGIDAPAVAWKPLGWQQAFSSDIEPFPNAVRAHHDPDVPNYGDMTKFHEWPDHDLGLVCAGTPCQAFSVAGLRKGLDDPRGNLTLVFLGILDRYRPEWVVWENVPGVLSIDGGRVFGTFLGGLGQLGYGFAYRVLDAQHFGVPQRRRRVFVVGHLGSWRRAAAVLFERHSMLGDPAPSREAREGVAGTLAGGAAISSGPGWWSESDVGATLRAQDSITKADTLIPQIANPLTARMGKGINTTCDEGQTPIVTHSLRAEGFDASEDGTGRGTPLVPCVAPTLRAGGNRTGGDRPPGTDVDTCESLVPVAFHNRQDPDVSGSITHPIGAKDNGMGVAVQQGDPYAGTQEADSSSLLSTLRDRIGTEAVAEWGSRVLDSLQSPEVLRAWLHGEGLRRAAGDFKSFVDDRPLPREEGEAARTMRVVWENGPDGRTPQGRGLAKQLARELGKALPQLPHQDAPRQSGMQVRRLTPVECSRLQGFPDNYLTQVSWRGKVPPPDGPMYKALGNSMAVPCMRWIGERVQMVEELVV